MGPVETWVVLGSPSQALSVQSLRADAFYPWELNPSRNPPGSGLRVVASVQMTDFPCSPVSHKVCEVGQ